MTGVVVEIAFFALMALMIAGEITTYSFFSPVFDWGIPVYSSRTALSPPGAPDGQSHETEHWVFKAVSLDRVLVRPRMRFFALRVQGIVGTVSWQDGSAILRFRLQLSIVAFLVFWLSGWLIGGGAQIAAAGASSESLGPLAFGLFVFVGITSWTIGYARSCVAEFVAAYEHWSRESTAHA